MKTKVAIYYSLEDIRIEEAQIPKIASDEILVKMKACGICGSDLMEWYIKNRAPLVLGHEPSGVVAKVGDKVTNFKLDDRVFVHHHVACMTCHYCIKGAFTMCDKFKRTHIEPGGFSEYFKVPSSNLMDTLKIPEELSFEVATLIEPVACCIRALNKCGIQQEDSIVIIGAGVSGLIHEMLLKNLGVEQIIISDLINFRLNVAKKLGANLVLNPAKEDIKERVKDATGGRGADVVIVTSPSIDAIKSGIDTCSKGGTLCIYAPPSPTERLPINLNNLFFSEIRIICSYSASHIETRNALRMLQSNKIRAKDIITHCFPLSESLKAYNTASTNKESLKVVVTGEE